MYGGYRKCSGVDLDLRLWFHLEWVVSWSGGCA